MSKRIGLVHSVVPAIRAVEDAFQRIWPEAQSTSIYDQSTYQDLGPDRSLTPEIFRRIAALLRYSADCGVDGILVTGSLFGPAAIEGRKALDIPVITSFDGLIDEALAAGSRFNMIATDPGTNRMLAAELEARAAAAGKAVTLNPIYVPDAMALLQGGDRDAHDRLVVEAAAGADDCDAILLGQFSMGPTRPLVEKRAGKPVLDAPDAAVRKLRATFDA
ncbi:MAG: aspartate/glutamate racemase family protein [Gammaproteobacteria bacterium]|jgi:Asp/Glu/hydantoin racemase